MRTKSQTDGYIQILETFRNKTLSKTVLNNYKSQIILLLLSIKKSEI